MANICDGGPLSPSDSIGTRMMCVTQEDHPETRFCSRRATAKVFSDFWVSTARIFAVGCTYKHSFIFKIGMP